MTLSVSVFYDYAMWGDRNIMTLSVSGSTTTPCGVTVTSCLSLSVTVFYDYAMWGDCNIMTVSVTVFYDYAMWGDRDIMTLSPLQCSMTTPCGVTVTS